MRPRKLRHRPSDELVDIRESELRSIDRGLPWLFSVFVVLFLLLAVLLFYFIFTTRDVYLAQKKVIEEEDIARKVAAAQFKEESDEDLETWREELKRRKSKGKSKKAEEKVHVDIVPIVNRKTGEPDKPSVLELNATLTVGSLASDVSNTTTEQSTTSTIESTTTSSTTSTTTTTSKTTTSTTTTTTTEEPTTTTTPTITTSEPSPTQASESNSFEEAYLTEEASESNEDIVLQLEEHENIDDVQVEEYEETSITTTTSTSTTTTTTTPPPTTTTSYPTTITLPKTTTTTSTKKPQTTTKEPKNFTKIEWEKRPPRSRSENFSRFGIVTHHEECSEVGKKIAAAGGNAIDSVVAAEFCISAVHPHSTGPGFGAVMLVHSKKRNDTFVIDGRERAPKNANQNTFVINPTIAHIGYSSIGVPGWISTMWNAYKQFGSGAVTWKQLIEPTLELLETKTMRVDRLFSQAFEARKNQILHEKSFGNWMTEAIREGAVLKNSEYASFLNHLKDSAHAEHDFYGGQFAKSVIDEMKNRGGLMNRQDLESYSCIVTAAESLNVLGKLLAGPPLPYHFPILAKVFQNLTDTYSSNSENILEYYVDFVKLLQTANSMKSFVGDDLYETDVRMRIEDWETPRDFKPEEQVEQSQRKKPQLLSYSRIVAVDEEGNAVNFMSTNGVPWGSVRRSPTMGFIWNNAMSSFDVFCRHEVNCVKGGKRPSVTNGFPSILLDREKQPEMLISPTHNSLETTAAIALQATIMNLTPQSSLDHPRIYPQTIDQVFVETGMPQELYRSLWTEFRAQFTHPTSPVTLINRNTTSRQIEVLCDFRQNIRTCYPSGT